MIKKIASAVLALTLTTTLLVGCGFKEKAPEASYISIDKDLSVSAVIVDDFDQSVYDLDEFITMMKTEASTYNDEHKPDAVTPGETTVTENIINAAMSYATVQDYAEFNSRNLKLMSLDEALGGASIGASVKSAEDGQVVDLKAIDKIEKMSVLITDEVGIVKLPGKVVYLSDGVEVVGKKEVHVTDSMDGLAYIIFMNK